MYFGHGDILGPTRRIAAANATICHVNAQVDARRRDCAIAVLGGPTTVVDIAGRRIVMDPTFDPPGVHAYLTKTEGPAVGADALGPVDAVLISHDQHPDNLDDDGRRFALASPLVLTHPGTPPAGWGRPRWGCNPGSPIRCPAPDPLLCKLLRRCTARPTGNATRAVR